MHCAGSYLYSVKQCIAKTLSSHPLCRRNQKPDFGETPLKGISYIVTSLIGPHLLQKAHFYHDVLACTYSNSVTTLINIEIGIS